MASGSGLATALAALKGHAVAVAVVGTLVVGGGATAAAVATGTVHVPGVNTHQQENGGTTARAAACVNNGDAQRLAGIFAPMFDGDKAIAQENICTLFVGANGHARGFGEIQQALEITAAIEHSGDDACLTGGTTHGTPTTHSTPTTKGKPPTAGTPAAGQQTFTAPSATTSDTMAIVNKVLDTTEQGTPLGKLAQQCGATYVTGSGGDQGQPQGTPEAKPTGTPGAKPEGTPGAKPTGTPGAH
jgi:hypothetical protein